MIISPERIYEGIGKPLGDARIEIKRSKNYVRELLAFIP